MDQQQLTDTANAVAAQAKSLAAKSEALASEVANFAPAVAPAGGGDFLMMFTAFILACVVGYYVVWNVTPALHSPLMGVTNAISSVIIVGALIAAGPADLDLSKVFGFIAVILASINIFGGFVVTNRMLSMFKKKPKA
jgi:NAD(P) transhydrogenase subunit alpha